MHSSEEARILNKLSESFVIQCSLSECVSVQSE